jgi:tetratricopeptide (TPR) repeat protein
LDPASAIAHNGVANILKDRSDLDTAIEEYRKAIGLDPGVTLFHANLAEALLGRGDLDGSIAEFRRAIELDSKYASAHGNLAGALLRKGDPDASIVEFRRAIDLDPEFIPFHSGMISALAAKGDTAGFMLERRQVIALAPQSASGQIDLADFLALTGPVDEALVPARRAVSIDSKYAPGYARLGLTLEMKGDLDGAIAAYKQALVLDPKSPGPHFGLAIMYAEQDRVSLDRSLAEIRQLATLDPMAGHLARALLLAECAESKLRKPKEAIVSAKKVIEVNASEGMAWLFLGMAQYRDGQWNEALTALEKSLQFFPLNWGDRELYLALVHERLGHKDEARKWYQKGLDGLRRIGTANCPRIRRLRAEAGEVLGLMDGK